MDREDSYKLHKILRKESVRSMEILKELYEDCRLFRDLDIPVDLKIDIIEITKRIFIPFNSDFLYIIKEGNVFSWIGELEKSYRLDRELTTEEYFTIGRLKRGKIIQILGKGDILESDGYYFSHHLEKRNNIFIVSFGTMGCSIAGLPFEQDIKPLKLIRINLKEINRVFLKNKKRREIFLLNFLTFFKNSRVAYSYKFKAPQKIASALRICFLGGEPLGWYIEADNNKAVDNGDNLEKPKSEVFSFVIKTQHLGLMTGLSQPMIDSWLYRKKQNEITFFKKNRALAQHFKIEKIKGGYKLSLLTFSKKFLAHTCGELWCSLYGSSDPISHDEIEKRYIVP